MVFFCLNLPSFQLSCRCGLIWGCRVVLSQMGLCLHFLSNQILSRDLGDCILKVWFLNVKLYIQGNLLFTWCRYSGINSPLMYRMHSKEIVKLSLSASRIFFTTLTSQKKTLQSWSLAMQVVGNKMHLDLFLRCLVFLRPQPWVCLLPD